MDIDNIGMEVYVNSWTFMDIHDVGTTMANMFRFKYLLYIDNDIHSISHNNGL